ncbi:MAG TPA: HEAT repeat domain-containing protein [Anaeromyxobacter sp.]
MARWVLWALLFVSAISTVAGLPELQEAVAAGRLPRAILAIPPLLLGLFIVGYAAYRYELVREGRYPAGKAIVRVAVMLLVLGLVAGVALRPLDPVLGSGAGPASLQRALGSTDPFVRALGAELAIHRPREQGLAVAGRLVELLDDPAPEVRRQAHLALVALAGSDLGGEGAGAPKRWRAWVREAQPAR